MCMSHKFWTTEKRSEQICLKSVQNVHYLSLTGYCEQDRLSLLMGGLVRGGGLLIGSRLNLRSAWSIWHLINNAAKADSYRAGKARVRGGAGECCGRYCGRNSRWGWSRWRCGSGCRTAEAAEGEDPAGVLVDQHTLSLSETLSWLLYLWRTRSDLLFLILSLFPSCLLSWYLLIKIEFLDISCQSCLKTLVLLMFGKVYIYSNTHPLTRSQQYPPSHKCHINTPFWRVRYQAKKRRKVTRTRSPTRYDIVYISKKDRLRRRPLAALRGIRIQMTVQTLFTTISWKTCTEHVHNLSLAVPSMLWVHWHS